MNDIIIKNVMDENFTTEIFDNVVSQKGFNARPSKRNYDEIRKRINFRYVIEENNDTFLRDINLTNSFNLCVNTSTPFIMQMSPEVHVIKKINGKNYGTGGHIYSLHVIDEKYFQGNDEMLRMILNSYRCCLKGSGKMEQPSRISKYATDINDGKEDGDEKLKKLHQAYKAGLNLNIVLKLEQVVIGKEEVKIAEMDFGQELFARFPTLKQLQPRKDKDC
jgi:hypothetical protein